MGIPIGSTVRHEGGERATDAAPVPMLGPSPIISLKILNMKSFGSTAIGWLVGMMNATFAVDTPEDLQKHKRRARNEVETTPAELLMICREATDLRL